MAGLRWLLVQIVRCVLLGGCWCSVLRGGVASCGAVWAVAVVVLRGFFLSKVPFLDFLPDYYPLYFNPSSLGMRVCVCLLKMGLRNVSPWNLRRGTQCTARFWKNERGGAAVAALK